MVCTPDSSPPRVATASYVPRQAMRSPMNNILHGLFLGLYAFVKYLAFPFANYLRFAVVRLFAPRIRSSYIAEGVTLLFPWRIAIGEDSSLNEGTSIDGFGGVTIGSGVRIAGRVAINTADHAYADADKRIMDQGYMCAAVVIEDDVWIGSLVCINKGVTIGRGSVIDSGAVVTKDIPPYFVAAGVSCRVIRRRGAHHPNQILISAAGRTSKTGRDPGRVEFRPPPCPPAILRRSGCQGTTGKRHLNRFRRMATVCAVFVPSPLRVAG